MRESVGHLSKGVAIYGAGDAAIQVVKLLLLAVYVKGGYLDRRRLRRARADRRDRDGGEDRVALGARRRVHALLPRSPAGGPLERLTSTIVWFTLAADVVVFARALAGASRLDRSSAVPAARPTCSAFRLMLVNTFLISLTFVPFHVMRLRNEAVTYSALVFARSAGTVAAADSCW